MALAQRAEFLGQPREQPVLECQPTSAIRFLVGTRSLSRAWMAWLVTLEGPETHLHPQTARTLWPHIRDLRGGRSLQRILLISSNMRHSEIFGSLSDEGRHGG